MGLFLLHTDLGNLIFQCLASLHLAAQSGQDSLVENEERLQSLVADFGKRFLEQSSGIAEFSTTVGCRLHQQQMQPQPEAAVALGKLLQLPALHTSIGCTGTRKSSGKLHQVAQVGGGIRGGRYHRGDFDLLLLAAPCGSHLTISASGVDETDALQALDDLIRQRFGEDE